MIIPNPPHPVHPLFPFLPDEAHHLGQGLELLATQAIREVGEQPDGCEVLLCAWCVQA